MNLSDFNAVVSDIYEAALSPVHWDVALTGLVNRFSPPESDVAMLVWERLAPPAGRFIGATAVNEVARHGYLQLFAGRNPWSEAGHRLPIGEVAHTDRLVAQEGFRASSFYQDFLRHWRLDCAFLVALDRHQSSHLGLCIPLQERSDPNALEQALHLLVPHLRRAIRIARRINEADLALASAREILDASPSPVLMCTASLQVIYANRAGEALLETLVRTGPDLTLQPASRAAREQLDRLVRGTGDSHSAAVLLTARSERPVAALAMPMGQSGGQRGEFGNASLLLVAEPAMRPSQEAMRTLQGWFGLTWAEARLAVFLGLGGSLEEFARSRGVSVNAARFLLKGVFAKVGVNRQSSLVAAIRTTPIDWTRSGTQISGLPDPLG